MRTHPGSVLRVVTVVGGVVSWLAVSSLAWAQEPVPAADPTPASTPADATAEPPPAPAPDPVATEDPEGEYAPPSLDGDAPPSLEGAAEEGHADGDGDGEEAENDDNPPPPLDGGEGGAGGGPLTFADRVGGPEVLWTALTVAGGVAASSAVALVSVFLFSSVAGGRIAYDLPLTVGRMAVDRGRDTPETQILGANPGLMVGGIIFSVMASALVSGLVAAGVGFLSRDWETVLGPVVAVGLLASGVVAAGAGTAFVLSLLAPFPPLWALVLGGGLLAGVVVPPVAVAVGQVLTKRPRSTPGGLFSVMPMGGLPIRPPFGGPTP